MRLGPAIIPLVLVGFVYVTMIWVLPVPSSVFFMRGTTEEIHFWVQNPEMAVLDGDGLRLVYDNGRDAEDCLIGDLQPAVGAQVSYEMTDTGDLFIIVKNGASFTTAAKEVVKDGGDFDFRQDSVCGRAVSRLPIYGPAIVGANFRHGAENGGRVLPDIRIELYGRSVRDRSNLYAVWSAPMTVAPGAQIRTLDNLSASSDARASIVGYAVVGDGGLNFQAVSEAPKVFVLSPLPNAAAEYDPATGLLGADSIYVDRFTQLLSDPVIIVVQVMMLMLSFLVTIGPAVAATFKRPRSAAPPDQGHSE